MKKYFTFIAALALATMAYAQTPSSAEWTKGQDVSADLAWGDYDGTWSAGGTDTGSSNAIPNQSPYWQGDQPNEMSKDEATTPGTYPAMAYYLSGAVTSPLINTWQVVKLPAGMYTFKMNAVYREGTNEDTWASYEAKNPKRNCHMYVQTYTATSTVDDEPIRSFDKAINTLPYSTIHQALLSGHSESWRDDKYYVVGNTGTPEDTIYFPSSPEGAALHFAADNFEHSLKFILLNDGFIKIGVKKTANIAQDWFAWSRMRIIYEGPADEAAQLELALSELTAMFKNFNELKDRVIDGGYAALAGDMEDFILEFSESYDEGNTESVVDATNRLQTKIDEYNKSFASAQQLSELISSSEDIFLSTDFSGKADFKLAITAAKNIAEAEVIESADDYTKAFNSLSAARATYLNTQEVGSLGEKDFSSLIKHPWFVNPENTPVQLEDGTWCIQQDGVTDMWRHYTVAQRCTSYKTVCTGDRIDVASKVTLSADNEATNQWVKYMNFNGWSPGLNLMYQGALIGVSDGWNSISGGSNEIRQQLVGLPEGYYSIKGLMRGYQAGATWDGLTHNIFAQNSDGKIVKSAVGNTDSYYSPTYGWDEWNANVWQEHKTSIVPALDGKLLIGAQTSMVMNATGFRLYFYGTEPPFDKMIAEDIKNVESMLETKSLWPGDTTYVKNKLDAIYSLRPIASTAAYDQAVALANDAKEYIRLANQTLASWSVIEDYTSIQLNYEEESEQYNIINVPLTYVLGLPETATATYLDAQDASAVYDAYASYITMYDKAAALQSTTYTEILTRQGNDLKANYSNVETLNAYETEFSQIYSQEVIKALGGDLASKENPVDVTTLIQNPNFDGTGSWSGTTPSQNEYGAGRHTAEIWNNTTFDMYQVLQGMPNGLYQLTAQALYRDGNGNSELQACYQRWIDCGQDKEAWENHNAVLYAKTSDENVGTGYITSVCDTKETGLSFPGGFKITDSGYTVGNDGTFLLYEELTDEDKAGVTDEGGNIIYDSDKTYNPEGAQFQYPFDGRVYPNAADSTTVYYYPESMAGAALRFAKGEYPCSAEVTVYNAGENLTIGIKKTAGFSGDWVIFSNFKLYYLGIPTAIEAVKTVSTDNGTLYNVAGQAVSAGYKGIVIKNGKKVLNK